MCLLVSGAGCQDRGASSGRGYGSPAAEPSPARDPTLPKSLQGLWAEILKERESFGLALDAGRLEDAGLAAKRIRDLVAALPPLSGQYVSTRQGPLTDAVRRAQAVVADIEEAATRGDSSAMAQSRLELIGVIEHVSHLYPAGTLPLSSD